MQRNSLFIRSFTATAHKLRTSGILTLSMGLLTVGVHATANPHNTPSPQMAAKRPLATGKSLIAAASTVKKPTPAAQAQHPKSPAISSVILKAPASAAIRRLATRKVVPTTQEQPNTKWRICYGQVLGANRHGIPGACVYLNGNRQYITATDAEGQFSLRLPTTQDCTLTIAYLGLAEQQVNLSTDSCLPQMPITVNLTR